MYLDLRPGWVKERDIMEINVTCDRVQFVTFFRQTINFWLL